MITIKKNKDIPLDIPHFACDENAVGKHLNDHPLTELMNVYGFLCAIGRPGSGKTSLTISLITQKNPKIYRKTHHHIIVLMPQNSISSLAKNPFNKLNPENIYNEINENTINAIYNKIDGFSEKDFLDNVIKYFFHPLILVFVQIPKLWIDGLILFFSNITFIKSITLIIINVTLIFYFLKKNSQIDKNIKYFSLH